MLVIEVLWSVLHDLPFLFWSWKWQNMLFANETPFLSHFFRGNFFVSFELYVEQSHQLLLKDLYVVAFLMKNSTSLSTILNDFMTSCLCVFYCFLRFKWNPPPQKKLATLPTKKGVPTSATCPETWASNSVQWPSAGENQIGFGSGDCFFLRGRVEVGEGWRWGRWRCSLKSLSIYIYTCNRTCLTLWIKLRLKQELQ